MQPGDEKRIGLEALPSDVLEVCARLHGAGKRAWVVGGCVRDSLMNRPVSDWDIATDALPDELMKIFPRAIPTGIEHGTVTVVHRKKHFEVTTLRGEGAYTDGRRPDEVHFVDDITADLARRDFTVNAIAVDASSGVIVDPFDGRGDLSRRVLRAVGVPLERFREDGLRALRAARFVATLDMQLDDATRAAIPQALDTYKRVSAERVRDEWVKTMKADKPSRAFDVMRETGLLDITCPELTALFGVEQNRYHAFDVWRHSMECMDACFGDPTLRIAALFHDIGKPQTRELSAKTGDYTFYDHERIGAEIVEPICGRLRFSNDERARIAHLVRHHLFHYSSDWTDAAVRRWIRRVTPERIEDLYRLNEADVRAKGTGHFEKDIETLAALKSHVARIILAGDALNVRDLRIGGRDLITELSVRPGKIIGEILDALLEIVTVDPSLNDREQLLQRAREILSRSDSH